MRWLITLTLLAVVVVIWYYIDSNKAAEEDDAKARQGIEEVVKLINKDLETSYPYTAREVVQLYIRFQKCFYNEKWTDDEFVKLAYQARELFDEELKNNNPFDEYYDTLREEVAQYKKEKKIINQEEKEEIQEEKEEMLKEDLKRKYIYNYWDFT